MTQPNGSSAKHLCDKPLRGLGIGVDCKGYCRPGLDGSQFMRLATLFAFSAAAVSALTSGGKEATKRLHVIRVSFTANTLANIASFLPDRAHDFPFTKRVGPEKGKEKFVTTPVEWLAADGTKIADATKIAALKTPEGDVFPSATAVALDVAKLFAS